MRRSKIGLGREMKELGPALGGHWHIIFSKRKAENFPPQVTSRTWSTRLHARTSVRLRIPILPGRNFAHWTRSSNSLASTAICFFFLAPKGVWPSFQWGDRHDFLFFLLSFLFGFFFLVFRIRSCTFLAESSIVQMWSFFFWTFFESWHMLES